MLPGRRAQLWRHHPRFRRPRHFHAEPELNVVLSGRASFGIGDATLTAIAGDLLLFPAGQDHVLLDATEDFDLFVMALTPELVTRARLQPIAAMRSFRVAEPQSKTLVATLAALPELRDDAAAEEHVVEAFRVALRHAEKADALSRRALEQLWRDRAASAADLARNMKAAPSSLSRRFHHDFGVRLVEYRARVRLMDFVQRVDDGAPLLRAALSASFGSYAQCHRVFRRVLGCAPEDYFRGARGELDQLTLGSPRTSSFG